MFNQEKTWIPAFAGMTGMGGYDRGVFFHPVGLPDSLRTIKKHCIEAIIK
jgi:hypothetical protein